MKWRKHLNRTLPYKYTIFVFVLSALVLLLGIIFVIQSQINQNEKTSAQEIKDAKSSKTLAQVKPRKSKKVCGNSNSEKAECLAHVVVDDSGEPEAQSVPNGTYSGGKGPKELHAAYNLPCTPGGPVQWQCPTPTTFGPTTIAIVVAYSSPTLEADLSSYSQAYGIPDCTVANGCLTRVNQRGATSPLPIANAKWNFEEHLDVQIAHTICQTCRIVVVETDSNSYTNLATGVRLAATYKPVAISNSWGGTDFSSGSYDASFNQPGIAVVASSGDVGGAVYYPASLPSVVAVGGTMLYNYTDLSWADERPWVNSGNGCASLKVAGAWQNSRSDWAKTNCGSARGIVDVSAVAEPATGVLIKWTGEGVNATGWNQVGGTSLSAPIIAGVFALGNSIPTGVTAPSILYESMNSTNSHDLVEDSACLNRVIQPSCTASPGYDLPSGLGTPNGVTGFMKSILTPTPGVTTVPTVAPTTSLPTPTSTVLDSVPPTVNITSPLNGGSVSRGSTLVISASASDNVGVTKVAFYDGTILKCTDTTVPYTCSWTAPIKRNAVSSLTARAYDAANNQKTSSIVKVTSR